MNTHHLDDTMGTSIQFADKLRQYTETSALKDLIGQDVNPFLAEIESNLDGISLYELMGKETDELLRELDAYIESSTEEDCNANKVFIYLAVLQEKTPVTVNVDEDALRAGIEHRLSVATLSSHKQKPTPRRNWRSAAAVAAASAVLIILFTTTTAYGKNFLAYIVQWGDKTFQISRKPASGMMQLSTDSDAEYKSLADALEKNGFSSKSIPTWIPTRLNLYNIAVEKVSYTIVFTAEYHSDEHYLSIIVVYNPRSDGNSTVEKNTGISDEASIYENHEEEYRVVTNIETSQAAWVDTTFSYSIVGNITEDEIKMMIDSIYER